MSEQPAEELLQMYVEGKLTTEELCKQAATMAKDDFATLQRLLNRSSDRNEQQQDIS